MTWSPQQEQALAAVARWLRDDSRTQQVFRLFGYAGTGKTTLAQHFAEGVRGLVAFGAFTGKAALVMRKKGCRDASTIHSMIYVAEEDERGHVTFRRNEIGAAARAKLIIIDECSMVGEELGRDLLSFGKPVLVLGDPAQLPPVEKGADRGGFFTAGQPDVMLTEVHRQAAENPIIDLATRVRQGKRLVHGRYGTSEIVPPQNIEPEHLLEYDQVLVGLNRTRSGCNRQIRALKGFGSSLPLPGDKLVCLKNNRTKGFFNGGLWKVHESDDVGEEMRLLVDSEDFEESERKEAFVPKPFFVGGEEELDWRYLRGMDSMTYGYALTVHKAQGSQWDSVLLFDESGAFRDRRWNWIYTGLTRAAERITMVL